MAFKPVALIICCAAAAASSGVHAVGFGRVSPVAVLGQPLSVSVPIMLDQGERLFAECVQAEVSAGDSVLPPSQVRVSVQPTANPAEWIARVSTVGPILEPIIEVSVSAGCERRFMRRFTAFADPPVRGVASASALPMAEPAGMRPLSAMPSEDGFLAPASRSQASKVSRSVVVRKPAEGQASSKPAASKSGSRAAPVAAAAPATVARLMLDVGGPRLRMDMDEPVFMPVNVAGAASGAADGPMGEFDRLLMLEKTLGDLKRETQAYRNNEAGLKARLAEAESRSRLVPWLLGLLALAGAGGLWLALRARRAAPAAEAVPDTGLGQLDKAQWWRADAPAGAQANPGASRDAEHSGAMLISESAELDAAGGFPVAPYERTQPFAALDEVTTAVGVSSISDGQVPVREVSVEELLDLEQQADFFIALGQEEAAIDLLMSHLRGTGGQSPLPYTKLLEIYRRQGDRSAYERIRARFNRRFNAYAPDWDQGPLHGRNLEDYPDVVARLEELWASPLNSMAVLEAMLFRNDESQELFDLPAYKDVLLLYSLARDLYQQQGVSAADVDLLLPLGDDDAFAGMSLTPRADSSGLGADLALAPMDRPAGYDLTEFSLDVPAAVVGDDRDGKR